VTAVVISALADQFSGSAVYIPSTRDGARTILQSKIKGMMLQSKLPMTDEFWRQFFSAECDPAREETVTYREVYYYNKEFLGLCDSILCEVAHDMSTNGGSTLGAIQEMKKWWSEPGRMKAFEKAFPDMWRFEETEDGAGGSTAHAQ
jgi:hypothetical protein